MVQVFLAAPDAFGFVLVNIRLTIANTGLVVIAGASVFSRVRLCNYDCRVQRRAEKGDQLSSGSSKVCQ